MIIENIIENASIVIDEKYATILRNILKNNKDLPINIDDKNTVYFNDYTIGEFRIKDLTINIHPRNRSFSLQDFFKILQFIDRPLNKDLDGFGFEETFSTFKLDNISTHFCVICEKLLQFGLTGGYSEEIISDKIIHGDIYFDDYCTQLQPYKGITSILNTYDLNIQANQIIKSAVSKLIKLESQNFNPLKYQIIRDLESVDDNIFELEDVNEVISIFYSTNPYYPIALEYASKILFDLKLEYRNGKIEWLAFLENSNTIFEKYVFRILELYIPEKIEKWDFPKKFAKLKSKKIDGYKSFSPDIIINFNENSQSCKAVLDVKNKQFEPCNKSNHSDLISSSDLYQILFYCRQLKTNIGGIVYPSSTSNDPIQISLDSDGDVNIYLFSLNMNENIKIRHDKLVNEINQCVLSRI
jgi:5-methylcytosine-specific restriction enzyme subunit McrC